MSHEINLTPYYDNLRKQFTREARIKAETILANLLPEHMIEPHLIKGVQLVVLREFQAILNSIDMVTQCTVSLQQLMELRELTHHVSQTIIKKADGIERDLAVTGTQTEGLFTVFNVTDQIDASMEPMSETACIGFMHGFRDRFRDQGYYKTAEGERISPDAVVLELRPYVPIVPPHLTFRTSDGYKLTWSVEHQVWFTGESWDDRDMEFDTGNADGWPVDSSNEPLEGDYITEDTK